MKKIMTFILTAIASTLFFFNSQTGSGLKSAISFENLIALSTANAESGSQKCNPFFALGTSQLEVFCLDCRVKRCDGGPLDGSC